MLTHTARDCGGQRNRRSARPAKTALLATLAALAALAAPSLARADAVSDWNVIASGAIVASAGQPPPVSALSFAMVQGAVYDAVNAIDRGHQPYLAAPPAKRRDSKDAAVATAAFEVLAGLFPSQLATLQPIYNAYIAPLPDKPVGSKAAGITVGEAAAAAMLAARANDGRGGGPGTFVGMLPGLWRPTPPFFAQDPAPWVMNVLPFLIKSPDQFRSRGPNELTSRKYAKEFAEVKEIGSVNSATRTPDQTDAAIFWQDHALVLWNRIFRTLGSSQGSDTAENARMFAMTNMAAADAYIGCWNDKYYWKFWRPITAIREADTDGNPATQADPTWRPLFDPATPVASAPPLVTPPFPDHPSGHTCVAGAITKTLRSFFGTDKAPFSVLSNKSGTSRGFNRISDALKENIDARVWAGIHFRTADVQGAVLGKKVARYLRKHYFEPVNCR